MGQINGLSRSWWSSVGPNKIFHGCKRESDTDSFHPPQGGMRLEGGGCCGKKILNSGTIYSYKEFCRYVLENLVRYIRLLYTKPADSVFRALWLVTQTRDSIRYSVSVRAQVIDPPITQTLRKFNLKVLLLPRDLSSNAIRVLPEGVFATMRSLQDL